MINGIYTFVDDDGTNIHINAEGLRQWCAANKPEIFNIPLRPEVAVDMIKNNVISMERVHELAGRKNLDPIIMCKDGTFGDNGGPNIMIVDGHHRYVLICCACAFDPKREKIILGYVLEVEQWKPFQIHGLPNVTKEDLIKQPITKRNY
jgi:hypothetical protein